MFDGVTTRHVCEGVNVTWTYITGYNYTCSISPRDRPVLTALLYLYCTYEMDSHVFSVVENRPCLSIPMTFKGKQHISCDVFENSDVVQFIHCLAVNLLLLISQ